MNTKLRAIRGKAGVLGRTVDIYNGHKLILSKIIHNDAHEEQVLREVKAIIQKKIQEK